jgi:hypothetical protein
MLGAILSSTFPFSPPLGDHFSIFAIPHGRQTPPLPPLSMLWHFTCQLLFIVAKVIYSVSVLPRQTLPFAVLLFISAIEPSGIARFVSFLRFLHPAVGISFQSDVQAMLLRNRLSFL